MKLRFYHTHPQNRKLKTEGFRIQETQLKKKTTLPSTINHTKYTVN